jgi:branched-chain amino acid transport system substrate-binding protein
MITAGYMKSPVDPRWFNDPGMNEWRAFMAKYYPDGDNKDAGNVYGANVARTLVYVLTQCGDDLSRENIMKHAANLKDLEQPLLLPGVKINTSPTNYYPIQQLQMERWTGTSWLSFGDLVTDTSS